MMGPSEHIFDDHGVCIWCGTKKADARTKNCPLCPYDDGMAYINEVDEP